MMQFEDARNGGIVTKPTLALLTEHGHTDYWRGDVDKDGKPVMNMEFTTGSKTISKLELDRILEKVLAKGTLKQSYE